VDESVGRLVDTLEKLNLDENTIVIYSSDQGFYIGDHGWFDKRWMYEESLKMPFIVKWPGVVKPGSKNEKMIQNLDYAETFLDVAKTAIPSDMQGRSLLPLFAGESPRDWRDSIYYHYYEYPSSHMVPRHNGIRTERYKLMHFYEFDEWEFYDLKTDPDELTNLYHNSSFQKLIAQHKQQLDALEVHYEDDTDRSEKPLEWQKEVRASGHPRP
jgi:arylsulfatase A-like enzyme